MSVPAIILAAGASRRLGQPKQLVEFDGETLLDRSLRLARESGAAPVLVVLGANSEKIYASVKFGASIPVLNEHWEQGIATSIHAGIREADARAGNSEALLLMTCDQPRLTAEHLAALSRTFRAQTDESIIASEYAGTLGIPAIFPRKVFGALRSLHGDQGARGLLVNAPCPVIPVPFEGGEIDIDRPADLAHLR